MSVLSSMGDPNRFFGSFKTALFDVV